MEATWNQEGSEVIITQKSLIETMSATYLPAETRDPGKSGQKPSLPLEKEFFEPPMEKGLEGSAKRKFQAIVGGLLFITKCQDWTYQSKSISWDDGAAIYHP